MVAAPTTGDADRVANDLRAYLGPEAVDTFPAWETLPFERISPSVETMGRRLRTMWRLQSPERAPRVLVAPVRALVQRLGPHVEDVEPVVIRPGEQRDRDELLATLVGAGYHREEVVEHRGSLAVRGSIIDVFPSTADRPVRIDLWGDEVDRLTEFAVGDQRSTDDLDVVEIFGCRELLPTDEVRERAERLIALEPWGREQWERLSQGQMFEGMESWLPWLTEGEHVLFDLVGDDALVLLLEPRRMRDRAADLLHEEADLAASLAKTWSAVASGGEEDFPRLHLPFDRLLSHTSGGGVDRHHRAGGPRRGDRRVDGHRGGRRRPRARRAPARRAGRRRLPHRGGGRRRGLRRPAAVAAVVARHLADHRRHTRSSAAASCPPSSWR